MADDPKPEQTLNFEGPVGDTVFRRFIVWCLPAGWEPVIQAEIDEVFAHLGPEEDRAVAVVGALVIENGVNQLVGAHVPGFKRIAHHRDFTLSMRIELARALRLCPSRLLGAADTIRHIRNEFAHKLSLKSLDECEKEHLASASDHLRGINRLMVEGKTNREIFRGLVGLVYIALRGYAFHVERLNKFVREEKSFMDAFKEHCIAKYEQFPMGA